MAQIKMPAWNGEEVVEYQSYKKSYRQLQGAQSFAQR